MEFQNICNEMVAPFLLRHRVCVVKMGFGSVQKRDWIAPSNWINDMGHVHRASKKTRVRATAATAYEARA